jgi:glycosyltransferase involved in cell wall biosynthesis
MLKLGHETSVLCTGPEAGISKSVIDGVSVYRAKIRNLYFHHSKSRHSAWQRQLWHLIDIYNLMMKEHIREVISAERPDVVSCHNLTGWSIAAWDTVSEFNIPIVQVLHDYYLLCPKSTMFDGNKICSKQCSICKIMRLRHSSNSKRVAAVVGVSNFILDKFINYGYFNNTKVREVIHNVRNANDFAINIKRSYSDTVLIFGFIGTISPSKGVEILLKTFLRIAKPHWRLHIAGTGEKKYEEYLKVSYKDRRIVFLGRCVQDDFFKAIDICVVPSIWEEPFGMVITESLMFGVPVIGADRGGITEILDNGTNGISFNPDKPEGLENAMKEIAENMNKWRQKRDIIIQSSLPFTDINAWTNKWKNIYEKVCR